MIRQENNRLIVEFRNENEATTFKVLLNSLFVTATPEPSFSADPLKPRRVVLTEERTASLSAVREAEKRISEAEKSVARRLQDGLLPFRKLDSPLRVPMKNSPRTKGVFADGNPPTTNAS